VRSSHSPDAITVCFDDDHAVADAGLILAATLADGLMLRELVDTHVDLGSAPGAANAGDKAMTLIHSALAGGEWIEDAGRLLAQERPPGRGRRPRRRIHSMAAQRGADRGGRDPHAEPEQLALDALVAPGWVLPGQATISCCSSWSSGGRPVPRCG
jgi:hypothetical protein